MSATLSLELSTAAVERLAADVLVTPFFESDRPLRGPAARVDWRLCGLLSERLIEEAVRGARGDAVLLPTGGRLRVPLVLALGLGTRAGFGLEAWREVVREGVRRLLALRVGLGGFALPSAALGGFEASRVARTWLEAAALAVAERPSALAVRLLVPATEAAAARAGLAEAATALRGGDVAVRLSRASSSAPEKRAGEPRSRAERPEGARGLIADPGRGARPGS